MNENFKNYIPPHSADNDQEQEVITILTKDIKITKKRNNVLIEYKKQDIEVVLDFIYLLISDTMLYFECLKLCEKIIITDLENINDEQLFENSTALLEKKVL